MKVNYRDEINLTVEDIKALLRAQKKFNKNQQIDINYRCCIG
jgi:hypothetical protein